MLGRSLACQKLAAAAYQTGDITGDGVANIFDVTQLIEYQLKPSQYETILSCTEMEVFRSAVDMNWDNIINVCPSLLPSLTCCLGHALSLHDECTWVVSCGWYL